MKRLEDVWWLVLVVVLVATVLMTSGCSSSDSGGGSGNGDEVVNGDNGDNGSNGDDDGNGDDDTNGEVVSGEHDLLAIHRNADGEWGEGAYISRITVQNGECQFTLLHDVYPDRAGTTGYNRPGTIEIHGHRVALGLHNDFNDEVPETGQIGTHRTRGGWFDLDGNLFDYLPLVPAENQYRFSYITRDSVRVAPSGHVFYRSNTNDRNYMDHLRNWLIRFNPADGAMDQSPEADNFAAAQPETSDNVDGGVFESPVYSSPDGRYAYGVIHPYGVSGGQLVWEGRFMFSYDFEENVFDRLAPGDVGVTLYGMTADGHRLVYMVDGVNKVLDLQTGQRNELINLTGVLSADSLSTTWNSAGFLRGGNNEVRFFNVISDQLISIPAQGTTDMPQMSADGKRAYFTYRNHVPNNYLYMTSDLTSNAQLIEVCPLPVSVAGILVVK